jgi:purine nucleosidase
MNWPTLNETLRLERLAPPTGRVDLVLDTDTYNEVDDQFAVCHALLSPDRINLLAIHAAPFHNARSTGPEDGMLKSYDEIQRLLDKLGRDATVVKGSTDYLADAATPQRNDGVDHLIELAGQERDGPLYVAAIGAITNVASALLVDPSLVERIVVVWLGGHAHHWPHCRAFNLEQDVAAARVVFDSGVPLAHMPCLGCVDRLLTSKEELAAHLKGKSAIGDYLVDIVADYSNGDRSVWSKVLWDVIATAWLVNPAWVHTSLIATPIITTDVTWSFDQRRHLHRSAYDFDRDAIFEDLFTKLANA